MLGVKLLLPGGLIGEITHESCDQDVSPDGRADRRVFGDRCSRSSSSGWRSDADVSSQSQELLLTIASKHEH